MTDNVDFWRPITVCAVAAPFAPKSNVTILYVYTKVFAALDDNRIGDLVAVDGIG